jgi:hypothetical protein
MTLVHADSERQRRSDRRPQQEARSAAKPPTLRRAAYMQLKDLIRTTWWRMNEVREQAGTSMTGAYRLRRTWAAVFSVVLPVWVALCGVVGAQQNSPQAAQTGPVRADDLSSISIYTELQSRGIDPLLPTTDGALRRAYVNYDFATGGGHNLQTSDSAGSVERLNAALSKTAITSVVNVKTKEPGARIKYRLLGEQATLALPQLTNNAEDTVPIGLYTFWSERDGSASSKPERFRVIKQTVAIEIEEVAH